MNKMTTTDQMMREIHQKIQVPELNAEDYDGARRRRMIYRSKQGGWLEVDVLMGSWAENMFRL